MTFFCNVRKDIRVFKSLLLCVMIYHYCLFVVEMPLSVLIECMISSFDICFPFKAFVNIPYILFQLTNDNLLLDVWYAHRQIYFLCYGTAFLLIYVFLYNHLWLYVQVCSIDSTEHTVVWTYSYFNYNVHFEFFLSKRKSTKSWF